jgi:uncharacterized protein (DUF488 family)
VTAASHLLFTVGHSTRAAQELLALLREASVPLLVDVRRFPGSRRHPQFAREALSRALEAEGIAYRHEPDLGGRREARPDSSNLAWRNAAFRGYADHMATPEFERALDGLLAAPPRTAVMCAEALPWRCHRQLIADALVARGADVRHLLAPGRQQPHALHVDARVDAAGRVTYPRATRRQRGLFAGDADH